MSKGKDPAFLFYPADFLIGTMDMTDEEVGKYIRLLCRQHQKGHIKPELMQGLSEEVLDKFQKDSKGNYYNKRLKDEIEKREKYAESRRQNGLKGGRPKKDMQNHMQNHMVSTDKSTEKHTENENENKNEDINTNKRGLRMISQAHQMWQEALGKQ